MRPATVSAVERREQSTRTQSSHEVLAPSAGVQTAASVWLTWWSLASSGRFRDDGEATPLYAEVSAVRWSQPTATPAADVATVVRTVTLPVRAIDHLYVILNYRTVLRQAFDDSRADRSSCESPGTGCYRERLVVRHRARQTRQCAGFDPGSYVPAARPAVAVRAPAVLSSRGSHAHLHPGIAP